MKLESKKVIGHTFQSSHKPKCIVSGLFGFLANGTKENSMKINIILVFLPLR